MIRLEAGMPTARFGRLVGVPERALPALAAAPTARAGR